MEKRPKTPVLSVINQAVKHKGLLHWQLYVTTDLS